ncbi:hypothetical protein, partial [Acinetobacter baumannii]|uniref:hypothetical protein n=1 Tax=Acinetobacter baumannii TaxID=470 RepID=UPI002160EAF3
SAVGLDFATGMKSSVGLIALVVALYFAIKWDIPKAMLYPTVAVLLVVCLFPALNYYALEASEKSFNQTTNFLGQPVQEFSATTITVMWGMWYMKAVYMLVAGLMELFYKELGILKKIIFKLLSKKSQLYWLFYFSKRLFLV